MLSSTVMIRDAERDTSASLSGELFGPATGVSRPQDATGDSAEGKGTPRRREETPSGCQCARLKLKHFLLSKRSWVGIGFLLIIQVVLIKFY